MVSLRTLVLNQQFTPISLWSSSSLAPYTVSAKDVIRKYLADSCHVVYFYDRKVLTPSRDDLHWPSVIISLDKKHKGNNSVKLTRQSLFYRDNGKCCYCQKQLSLSSMTVEHIMPISLGGSRKWNNVAVACHSCNSKRGNSTHSKWTPKSRLYKPTYYDILEIRKRYPILLFDPRWRDFIGS